MTTGLRIFGLFSFISLALFPETKSEVRWEILNPSDSIFLSCADRNSAELAIKESLSYLNRVTNPGEIVFGTRKLGAKETRQVLFSMSEILKSCVKEERIPIGHNFDFVIGKDFPKSPSITGYYDVEIKGSVMPKGEMVFPLLSPNKKKKETHQRAEIIESKKWETEQLIAYVDLFDLHLAQLEGSALLTMEDGNKFRLNYESDNGHTYESPASKLLGVCASLKPHKLRECSNSNLDLVRLAILKNPRFIFFTKEELATQNKFPFGSGGIRLIPERSLAMDKRIPLGTPVLISFESFDTKRDNHLSFVHDRGSEIYGLDRVDFFFGIGNKYADLANALKTKGHVIFILPKLEK
ncbi:MAG: MltA domain-containing protein [Leptospira sp.]|nr:MltA domain-containing protein [Leptospira sp.]